jgi:hypothetical protein
MAHNRSVYSVNEFCRMRAGWGDFVDVMMRTGENHFRGGCLPVAVDDLNLVCPGSNEDTVNWLLGLVFAGWGLAILLAMAIVGRLAKFCRVGLMKGVSGVVPGG